MGVNVPLVSFAGGEIGKEAQSRIDLDLYPTTAEVMENIFVSLAGRMSKAPGTEYVGVVDADPNEAIVRPFVFNVDQTRVFEIKENEIQIVDGKEKVTLIGAAGTIGAPSNNVSSGGSSIATSGQDVTFTNVSGGQAKAVWEVTGGALAATSFSFDIVRRPLLISVGTTTSNEDILGEIELDPGRHVITILPTATTYYIRVRLSEEIGKAKLINLQRLSAGALKIATPYAASELRSLRFEQSNDVVWIYHKSHRTRVLERRGDTSWSLRLFRPLNGPFEIANITSTVLSVSALLGSVTVTANRDFFATTSVGQILELEHTGQTETVTATAVDQASDPIRVFGIETNRTFSYEISGTFVGTIKLQRSFGNTVDWIDYQTFTAPDSGSITDDLDNQIVYYRLVCSAYASGTIIGQLTYAGGSTIGRVEIVEYTDAQNVVAEVLEPFGSTSTTSRWSEGSWSDYLGWPAAGQIADSRHWLVRDDRVFASVSDDYENFLIGVDAADAISRVMGTGDVNASRWVEVGARIVVGTSGAEIEVLSNEYNERITYANVQARSVGDDGSADAQSIRAGKRIVFIDRTRTRLLQAYYDSDTGSTEIDNLVRLHEKIAGEIEQDSDDGFVEIAYQRMPDPRLWAVRSDGQLACMLYAPKEGIYAWQRYTAANGGKFKSICVVPGKPEDRVHALVEREIDGETVLYHERFALNKFQLVASTDDDGIVTYSAPHANRLQCSVISSGDPADTFTGLDHLEGERVHVWADGRYAGSYIVDGGSITISFEASYVIIGLNYAGKWKSSKLAFGARAGTALAQEKQVGNLGICIHETPIGALRYGRTFDDCIDTTLNEFPDGMIMDAPVVLVTEDFNQPFDGAMEIDSRVCLVMDTPAPVTILALIPNVDLEEKE